MRRLVLVGLACLASLALAAPAQAQFFPAKLRYDPSGLPPAYDLVTGRHVVHTLDYWATFPERQKGAAARVQAAATALRGYQAVATDAARAASESMLGPVSALPAPGPAWDTAWAEVGKLIVFGEVRDAEAYRALGLLHERAAQPELAWYAYQRALELGHPAADALRARLGAIEAAWRDAGRKDAPTLEHYRFVRDGAERWVASYQKSERLALLGKEDPAEATVLERMVIQADVEVPETILGADSFMRRWGVGLLIAGVGGAFWLLYLFAIFRRKRRAPAAGSAAI